MSHTALSLASSTNPNLLEMRIMTHHASDDRFTFLKGRYKDTWRKVKEEVRKRKRKPVEDKAVGALVGGYESSDEDQAEGEEPEDTPPPPPDESPEVPPDNAQAQEASCPGATAERSPRMVETEDVQETKRLRRSRLEEWKRKRAEEKAKDG